jgi:multiple sugar transport system permease protein
MLYHYLSKYFSCFIQGLPSSFGVERMAFSKLKTSDGSWSLQLLLSWVLKFPVATRKRDPSRKAGRIRDELNAWLFLLPALLLLIIFVGLPVILSLLASLYEIPLTGLNWKFVGFQNYLEALGDPEIRRAFINTILYGVLTIVPSIILGFALALLVESFAHGRTVLRTLLFLPVTANLVAMAIVFQWIFGVRGGFVNEILALIGYGPLNFLGSGDTAMLVLAVVGIWRYSSYNMVLYLAGLTAIPASIHEAAMVDGIRGFAKIRQVIWPLLTPSTVFVSVITFIQSIQVFETISVMTGGGPIGKTETLLFAIWEQGFAFFRIGFAAALSFLLLVITVTAGWVRRRAIASTEVGA